jgi:hypothetical protein
MAKTIANVFMGLIVFFPLLVIAPAMGVLFSERQMAAALEAANRAGVFAEKSDIELRRAVQKLGREHGFSLSTSDVIVWTSAPLTVPIEAASDLGYTLVLRLPLLWVFDFEVVTLRSVKVIQNKH